MEVPEAVLYHEVNKMRQQRSFQDRNKYPGPEDLPVPPPIISRPLKQEITTYVSEREIVRLLLKFGSLEFERKIRAEDGSEEILTVADYIVREIISDELTFDNVLCGTIFDEFRFASEQGIFLGDKVFIKNEDPSISSLSADILAESHQLSKIWRNKQTYVETEEMKLKDIVPDAVLKFKGDKIKLRLKEIMARLEEAVRSGDHENIVALQKKDQALKAALKSISQQLGNRILL